MSEIEVGATVCLKEWFRYGGALMTVQRPAYWDKNGHETGSDTAWECVWFTGRTLNTGVFEERDLVVTNDKGDYMRLSLKINNIISDIIRKYLDEYKRKKRIAPNNKTS